MRIVVAVAALMLVAGCSGSSDEPQATSTAALPTTTAQTTRSSEPVPPGPPPAGAPVAAVLAWVQAGTPADEAAFHSATRDGTTTDLGADVAFITPSGKTQCRTDETLPSGGLACLVEFTDPPAEPADLVGQWVGNWVDFDGPSAQVGSVHGDPGPFTEGMGPELPYGSALRFGDYQCRTDPTGLFCVNFARQTGLRMSDAGVVPFGCLQEVAPPADIGIRYECG